MYPLAHDRLGNAIEIPEKAVFWRVRRVTGRQGRPGFVYGQDGAPLKVPLDATAEDLQAAGCGPGTYKLDAVDEDGRPTGVSAFTEIAEPDGDEEGSRPPVNGGGEALQVAVEALARTVEAMQRSDGPVRVMEAMQRAQAEREKVTGQVLIALVDKLGGRGGQHQPPPDLRTAIKQALAVQEAMDEASERRGQKLQSSASASADDEDDRDEQAKQPADRLMDLVGNAVQGLYPLVAPALQAWIYKKIGVTDRQAGNAATVAAAASKVADTVRQAAAASAQASGPGEGAAEPPEPGSDAAPEAPANAAGEAATQPQGNGEVQLDAQQQTALAQAKLEEIWEKLGPEEREQAAAVLRRLKPTALDKLISVVVNLTVDDAVELLRAELRRLAAKKAKKTTPAPAADRSATEAQTPALPTPGDDKGQVNS